MKNEKKSRYKWPIKRKIVAIICVVYIVCFSSFLFLFYGPFTAFKEFWITSAMTTKSHQYLATFIYSDKYIQEVLKNNRIIEVDDSECHVKLSIKNLNYRINRKKRTKIEETGTGFQILEDNLENWINEKKNN